MNDDTGATDWFGNPVDDRGQPPPLEVPCPFCGVGFLNAAELDAHARSAHAVTRRSRRTRRHAGALGRLWRGLAFVPLWSGLPLTLGFAALVWVGWADDVWHDPRTAWYIVQLTFVVFIAPLPAVLYISARVFDR